MNRITPKSEEDWLRLRAEDVTSTEVSALFGLSPYVTEFELWHRKKGNEVVIFEDNERMFWGRKLEGAIAEGVAEKKEWKVKPLKDYGRIEEDYEDLRAGSSFDYEVEIPFKGLLEIKNVDGLQLKNNWAIQDGEVVEAPSHIEMQVQHQLMVSGMKYLYIAALVGGNQVVMLKRTPDAQIINMIKEKLYHFWVSIKENKPPNPDFKTDYEFIAKLYQHAEEGKVINLEEESDDLEDIKRLVAEYSDYGKRIKNLTEARSAVKAELLTKIGDAEKVIADSFTISAKESKPVFVPGYDRAGFRNFRVSIKKND